MNIYHIREELKRGKTIYDIQLRVAYYARVSTLSESQQSSIDNQQDYYKRLITENKNWTLVHEYVDHGISGMSTEKRENFQNMIYDAQKDEFDLIITKEIARFARNTLDSIRYTRELLKHGVAVWFQTDGINTIDEDSELRLAIMSSLAQDELRKLSNRIKFGHSQSIKKGHVLGTDNMYGYHKKDSKLQIVEKEAEMVRMIFRLYASGEWSTPKIEKHLYELGYRNSKGGKINRRVIGNIIQNPKYKGYFAGGKVKIVDMLTKKQEFLPESDWVMYKDDSGEIVPAIIDEETWEQANTLYRARGQEIKERNSSFKGDNIYTGKIVCGLDGRHYWLKQRNHKQNYVGTWVCSHKSVHGTNSCMSFGIKEDELNRMLANLLNEHTDNIGSIKEKYIEIYKNTITQQTKEFGSKHSIEKQLATISVKKEKLLDMSLDELITKEDFKNKNDILQKKYDELNAKLKQLDSLQYNTHDFSRELSKVLEKIEKYNGITEHDITRVIVETLIDKIVITPTDESSATVEFHLKDGFIKNKTICSSSVNMFKKMIEQQEKMMADKSNS